MWNPVAVLLLLATICSKGGHAKEVPETKPLGHVSVVVVGSTGDLAKKYLWNGFFQLYSSQVSRGHTFSFYGGGLSPSEKAKHILFDILKGVTCTDDLTPERCALLKDQFLHLVEYRQLNSSEHYQALCQYMEEQLKQEGMEEGGRLFYLSVPAFAYAGIAGRISNSCRPATEGAWLRVVLEKPFGHDLNSAKVLTTQLASSLKEEEMYRIDHYLGKQVVAKILPFRRENRAFLDPIWNKHHIERMEIVLKETLSAKGRIPFYDQYGVIRDVLQNHLTEVMTLLTMTIPDNLSNFEEVMRNKLKIFSALQPMGKSQAIIGQYEAYNKEVQQELNKTKDHLSLVPTFAAILAHIDSSQYEGIPIILTSGKMLDERVGYARILFKKDVFCVQKDTSIHCKPKQIVFHFGHGTLNHPAILVSKNLFKPDQDDGEWKEMTDPKDIDVLGLPMSDYYIQTPVKEKEAYAKLITHIFHGVRDTFVSSENHLASWGLWTPLLDSLAKTLPRIYPGGDDNGNLLDFRLRGKEVQFLSEPVVMDNTDQIGGAVTDGFQVMQGKYRSAIMVSAWTAELIERLAADLEDSAHTAVREGGIFHMALSGGSSPIALFQRLAQHHYFFPWRETHVWMVDERCVPTKEVESNFHTLHDHLLQHVGIPYFNIHPMPVQLNQRLCVEEDLGPLVYEKEIIQWVNGSSFHFVLLGVGMDGHTASLFPGDKVDSHGDRLVAITESPAKPHQRMSLTFSAINKAQKVGVLVMGHSKHELVTQLSRVKDNPNKWPITGVRPLSGHLLWYIDYDALLG